MCSLSKGKGMRTKMLNIVQKTIDEKLEIIDLEQLQQVNQIIRNNRKKFPQVKKYRPISLDKTVNLSIEFLNYLSKNYRNVIPKLYEEGQLYFLDNREYESWINNESMGITTMIDDKPVAYIRLQYNVEDMFTLTHECIHTLNMNHSDWNDSYDLFCEVLTFLAERLQYEYFRRRIKGICYTRYKVHHTIEYESTCIDFEICLLKEVMQKGYLNNYSIYSILEKYDQQELRWLLDHIITIQNDQELKQNLYKQDIYGYVLSLYLFNQIESQPKKIGEYVDLIDCILNLNSVEFLNYIGLEVNNKNMLTQDTIQELNKVYKKQLKEI